MATREGQYSISASIKKEPHLVQLGEEYRILSIRSGINFSKLVFSAMQYYKDNNQLPEVTNGKK